MNRYSWFIFTNILIPIWISFATYFSRVVQTRLWIKLMVINKLTLTECSTTVPITQYDPRCTMPSTAPAVQNVASWNVATFVRKKDRPAVYKICMRGVYLRKSGYAQSTENNWCQELNDEIIVETSIHKFQMTANIQTKINIYCLSGSWGKWEQTTIKLLIIILMYHNVVYPAAFDFGHCGQTLFQSCWQFIHLQLDDCRDHG